jgi:TonB family protein
MGVSSSRALAPLLSVGLHAILAVGVVHLRLGPSVPPSWTAAAETTRTVEITVAVPGPVVVPVPAASDAAGRDAVRLPGIVEVPGTLPAAVAGGAAGGPLAFTGRRDHESLEAQAWSTSDAYRLLRVKTARRRSSDDAKVRLPTPGEASQARRLAEMARTGQVGPGPGGVAQAGAVSRQETPDAPKGPLATETPVDGPPRENLDVARASDRRDPGTFEMTQPEAGGVERGIAGSAAPGLVPGRGGAGTAASRGADGHGAPAQQGADGDPYLHRLIARVLDRVVYPPELALAFEQGEVILSFTLHRDGSVAEVSVVRPSGHRRFDDEVIAALKRAAPFGPVPAALAAGKPSLRVRAPFAFDNPVIR